MSYFSWTANLGVVPLFLLAAFLFLPILVFLLSLILLVCCVLDAIIHTPLTIFNSLFNSIRKYKYLTFLGLKVKILLLSSSFAASQPQSTITHFLAKGEQLELRFPKLTQISIGNKDVIKHKYLKSRNVLVIKGHKLGFSDLVLWNKKEKQTHHFFVSSKIQKVKKLELSNTLKGLGLEVVPSGEFIFVDGVINSLSTLRAVQKIRELSSDKIILKTNLNIEVRNSLVAKIYQDFLSYGIQQIKCELAIPSLECEYQESSSELDEILKNYTTLYGVNFKKMLNSKAAQNFRLKLKIIQYQKSQYFKASSGLHQLNARVEDLFSYGLDQLIYNNQVQLSQGEEEINMLSEPETVLKMNEEVEFKIGADIQFQNSSNINSNQVTTTQWKFAGLKLKVKVVKDNGRYLIQYKNSFTSPSAQAITGSHSNSSLWIDLEKSSPLFRLGYQTGKEMNHSLPGLSAIPILGRLFSAKDSLSEYKTILGYIKLEKVP